MSMSAIQTMERYLEMLAAEKHYSPRTIASYRRDLGRFLAYLNTHGILDAQDDWDAIRHIDIRRYLGHLGAQGYKPATLARHVSSLRAFFAYLQEEDLLQASPMERITSPRTHRSIPSLLYPEQIEALMSLPDLDDPYGVRDRLILEI